MYARCDTSTRQRLILCVDGLPFVFDATAVRALILPPGLPGAHGNPTLGCCQVHSFTNTNYVYGLNRLMAPVPCSRDVLDSCSFNLEIDGHCKESGFRAIGLPVCLLPLCQPINPQDRISNVQKFARSEHLGSAIAEELAHERHESAPCLRTAASSTDDNLRVCNSTH